MLGLQQFVKLFLLMKLIAKYAKVCELRCVYVSMNVRKYFELLSCHALLNLLINYIMSFSFRFFSCVIHGHLFDSSDTSMM